VKFDISRGSTDFAIFAVVRIPDRNTPFHRFIPGNEAHTDETKIIQKDRASVQRTENTQTHLHGATKNARPENARLENDGPC